MNLNLSSLNSRDFVIVNRLAEIRATQYQETFDGLIFNLLSL
ncbi:hypothetical protein [Candidatus Endomicrobiellum trichonymphae]|nr:hypothetical protein [Candidatus Endomicrobium trichonymphae]